MSQQKKRVRAKFRSEVFLRDGFKCAMCGATNELDAHHITDRSRMPNGGYVAENGITLCPSCHKKAEVFHESGGALCRKGYAPDDLYQKIGSSPGLAFRISRLEGTVSPEVSDYVSVPSP